MTKLAVKQMKILTLAYMGDVVFEKYIREYLILSGKVKPQILHEKAVSFVSAKGQAYILKGWLGEEKLTEEELAIVRRGRNVKVNVPRNLDFMTYRYSTAFEALIGYLYFSKSMDRLNMLIEDGIKRIEERGSKDA